MGLTLQSTGRQSAEGDLAVKKRQADDLVVALAGNPNVGKSTVFNHLTRCHQHTGNWAGKTVATAQGNCTRAGRSYICVDLPGCYSLLSHSAEEELARDFLCFGGADAVAVVCDATCLERNLNLVLQTLEITNRVVVCVNLMDEARRKGTVVDINRLSTMLGVPVVATAARSGEGLEELLRLLERQAALRPAAMTPVPYPAAVEEAVALLRADLEHACGRLLPSRWVALRLLEGDATLEAALTQQLGFSLAESPPVAQALARGGQRLREGEIHQLGDVITAALVHRAEGIAAACVTQGESLILHRDRKLDRLLTSRKTGIPVMLLLLGLVFWLTISGANVPSTLLSQFFAWVRGGLDVLCAPLPAFLRGVLLDGAYGVLTWVVAVMLPPMAIFFPLFTLLEDLGYLPRVAFNLDKSFQRCHACGKQALTMCMVNIIMSCAPKNFSMRAVDFDSLHQ